MSVRGLVPTLSGFVRSLVSSVTVFPVPWSVKFYFFSLACFDCAGTVRVRLISTSVEV